MLTLRDVFGRALAIAAADLEQAKVPGTVPAEAVRFVDNLDASAAQGRFNLRQELVMRDRRIRRRGSRDNDLAERFTLNARRSAVQD